MNAALLLFNLLPYRLKSTGLSRSGSRLSQPDLDRLVVGVLPDLFKPDGGLRGAVDGGPSPTTAIE